MAKAIISHAEELSEKQADFLSGILPSSGHLSRSQLKGAINAFKKGYRNSEVLPNVISRLMRRKRKRRKVLACNGNSHNSFSRKGATVKIRVPKGQALAVH